MLKKLSRTVFVAGTIARDVDVLEAFKIQAWSIELMLPHLPGDTTLPPIIQKRMHAMLKVWRKGKEEEEEEEEKERERGWTACHL